MKHGGAWLALALGAILFVVTRPRARAAIADVIQQIVNAADPIRKLIEREEGIRHYAYLDSAGKWTIGIGHLILPAEQSLMQYTQANPAPDALIQQLFDRDVAAAKGAIDGLRIQLSTNQRAALVSLVFNIGVGAFNRSTLRQKLLIGDYAGAAAEFPKWKLAGGQPILAARRERERQVFVA